MILFILLVALVVIGLSAIAIDHDGYGTRPGPRSHHADLLDPWGPPR